MWKEKEMNRPINVTVEIPDDVANRLCAEGGDLSVLMQRFR